MDGSRKGRLGVCSQSLHSHVDWLQDWVEHQFGIGADEVILHIPKVIHVFVSVAQRASVHCCGSYTCSRRKERRWGACLLTAVCQGTFFAGSAY